MSEQQATDAIQALQGAGYNVELYYRPNGTYAVHIVEPYKDLLTYKAVLHYLRAHKGR